MERNRSLFFTFVILFIGLAVYYVMEIYRNDLVEQNHALDISIEKLHKKIIIKYQRQDILQKEVIAKQNELTEKVKVENELLKKIIKSLKENKELEKELQNLKMTKYQMILEHTTCKNQQLENKVAILENENVVLVQEMNYHFTLILMMIGILCEIIVFIFLMRKYNYSITIHSVSSYFPRMLLQYFHKTEMMETETKTELECEVEDENENVETTNEPLYQIARAS